MVKKLHKAWITRSFKRETAAGTLVAYMVLTFHYFAMRDPALVAAFAPAYNTVTMVVLPIIGLAFGVDAWWKQAPGAKT